MNRGCFSTRRGERLDRLGVVGRLLIFGAGLGGQRPRLEQDGVGLLAIDVEDELRLVECLVGLAELQAGLAEQDPSVELARIAFENLVVGVGRLTGPPLRGRRAGRGASVRRVDLLAIWSISWVSARARAMSPRRAARSQSDWRNVRSLGNLARNSRIRLAVFSLSVRSRSRSPRSAASIAWIAVSRTRFAATSPSPSG